MALDPKQSKQDSQYSYPYHYIPIYKNGNFHQARTLKWGYEYVSYLFFVIDKIKEIDFDSLLDVGCGDGRLLHELYKQIPDKRLVGLDYTDKSIQMARHLNPDIQFIQGDITTSEQVKEKFDIITAVEVLEHIPPDDLPRFVSGIAGHLVPEGRFIITVPSDNTPTQNKHYQHFNRNKLEQLLSPNFQITEFHYLNQISWAVNMIQTLLTNKYFILNHERALRVIFRHYKRHYLIASPDNCKRICLVCAKK
jgi:SAM-dependent methyltransferase